MRILLIEDDPRLGPLVRRALGSDGHAVELVIDGIDGLTEAQRGAYELLIVDRRLPRLDGLALLRALRTGGGGPPVLMLTALAELDNRVEGLDAGADDYLGKPFEIAELLARVRALGRRPSHTGDTAGPMTAGRLALDDVRHLARLEELEVELSAREYALLAFFIRHPGETLTRDRILEEVWGSAADAYANVVDLYVSYLRRKLEELGAGDAIATVRGRGYRLDPP